MATVKDIFRNGFEALRRERMIMRLNASWVVGMVHQILPCHPVPSEAEVAETLARLRRGWPELTDADCNAATALLNDKWAWAREQETFRKVA